MTGHLRETESALSMDRTRTSFQVRHEQGCVVIAASGPEIEFDSKDELYAIVEEGKLDSKHIILNLEQVTNYKSAILGVLIQFRRKVEKAGGVLRVVCSDPDILLMFHITKVDLVLEFSKNERAAFDAFQQPGA